jgi:ATP-dependent helicase/DNAse subunit B
MDAKNAVEILNNYYGLMIEINYHKPAEDYLDQLENANEFVNKHLDLIKLKQAKAKAIFIKKKYINLQNEFHRIKQYGVEELKKLLGAKERQDLVPLFRKFEELSKNEEIEIIDDNDFLDFISILKEKLNDETK